MGETNVDGASRAVAHLEQRSPLGALLDIHDNYPKFLITGDDQNPVMHNGIRQLFAGDFLLRKA